MKCIMKIINADLSLGESHAYIVDNFDIKFITSLNLIYSLKICSYADWVYDVFEDYFNPSQNMITQPNQSLRLRESVRHSVDTHLSKENDTTAHALVIKIYTLI